MPTALVTGASSGIGHHVAAQLLARSYTVIGLARRGDAMPEGVIPLSVDLTDPAALATALGSDPLCDKEIDALIHCAGYGDFAPLETTPLDDARRQLEVNVLAAVTLTQHVLPGMRERGHGRVVLVSSVASRFSSPMGGWYHASKAALESLADTLRMEVGAQGIDVAVVQPGVVATPWHDHALGDLVRRTSGTPYDALGRGTAAFHARSAASRMVSDPADVATVVVRAATEDRPRTRYRVGRGSTMAMTLPTVLPDRAWDRLTAQQLA